MKRIALFAGEISSDNYGSKLIEELKRARPALEIYAVGGEKMEREAHICIANIVSRAVVGFTEAAREIPFLLKLKKKIVENYFKLITVKKRKINPKQLSSKVQKLRGIIKTKETVDYKQALTEELSKKYGV